MASYQRESARPSIGCGPGCLAASCASTSCGLAGARASWGDGVARAARRPRSSSAFRFLSFVARSSEWQPAAARGRCRPFWHFQALRRPCRGRRDGGPSRRGRRRAGQSGGYNGLTRSTSLFSSLETSVSARACSLLAAVSSSDNFYSFDTRSNRSREGGASWTSGATRSWKRRNLALILSSKSRAPSASWKARSTAVSRALVSL